MKHNQYIQFELKIRRNWPLRHIPPYIKQEITMQLLMFYKKQAIFISITILFTSGAATGTETVHVTT
jgi:hypothetical protein